MMWWGGEPWSWGWGLGMGLGMLAFWALVIFGIVLIVRAAARPGKEPPHTTAEENLAERFARGVIDEEEYRSRLDVLHGVAAHGSGHT